MGAFRLKKPPNNFFNNMYDPIFNFMLLKINAKNHKSSRHWFFTKLEKPHLRPILCPFWPKNFKTKFFQKLFCSISILYAVITLYKISQKFHFLTFKRTWKSLFWAHFGHLLTLKLYKKVSPPKNRLDQFWN